LTSKTPPKRKKEGDGPGPAGAQALETEVKHSTISMDDLIQDALLVVENPAAWEAHDPGLTTLYEGHHDTRMSRKQWRYETGADPCALGSCGFL